MINIEHITYRYGGKQEDEAAFETEAEAYEYARRCFEHGGRVWINNIEITRKDVANGTETK